MVIYFLATTFVPASPWMDWVDLALGLLLLAEFLGRLLAHRHPMAYLDNASALIDLIVIASLLTTSLSTTWRSCASCGRYGCCVPTRCWAG